MGDEYRAKTQDKIKDIIQSAFNGETNRADIASKLKEEFGLLLEKDISYFELVADNAISQGQNIATINQSLQYDVKYFKVVARLDDKTSPICRSMHGKIISAEHLKNQVNNIVNAKNIDEKKQSAKWSNEPIYSKLPNNIGVPPYHGHCRTILEPVWVSEEIRIDDKTGKSYKIRNTHSDENFTIAHIDKVGVERVLKKSNIHVMNKHKESTEKDIIGALNSIMEIAPHSKYKTRTVAISSNGYFMVFEADEIVTIYKPTSINSKSSLEKHFKKNAILEKREILKWKKESLILKFLNGLKIGG